MRVVIADDHRLMLDGIRRALEDDGGFEIVGEARDGSEVIPLVARTRPDLVLLDVRMPNLDGIAALEAIVGRNPGTKVVMLSASTSASLVSAALARGASAYLTKSVDPTNLPATLREVMDGTYRPSTDAAAAGGESILTDRETAILEAVGRGLSNAEIGREMWITQQTVKFHLTNAYRKLGAKNRTDAIRLAYAQGLIDGPVGHDD